MAKKEFPEIKEKNEGKFAAWVKKNYQEMHLPSPIVKLFFSSWKDFRVSLQKVNTYYNSKTNTQIIPCHCVETLLQINPDSVEI